MNQTKAQFYTIWIIFGFVLYYSLNQFFYFFKQFIIHIGIIINVNPLIIKYSDYFFYGIIWIAIIIWSIIIIRDDKPLLTKPINKTLRLGFIIVLIIGLCSQIAGYLLLSNIPSTLEEYLNKHNIMFKDFYPVFQAGSGFGNLLICITLIVLFFILTRDYNKSTNANTAYKQWRKIDSI